MTNKKELFTTTILGGNISIDNATVGDYQKWMEIQKEISTDTYNSTTHKGFQQALNSGMKAPIWYKNIWDQLSTLIDGKIKSVWAIDYEIGGYQDPHIHAHSKYTVILNISGQGELLLFDPRPMAAAISEPLAEEVILNPGDFIGFPGWLMHSSRPTRTNRSILVMDFSYD